MPLATAVASTRHDVSVTTGGLGQRMNCFSQLSALPLIMKRINSPADDNIPIYIFLLLFAILLLSFLATTQFKRTSSSQ
ncbi:Branched-chain alpha-ketoacid dehydrogenase kinase/Pyruvate dehydrogenase kinase N-terminal [Penicillium nucicola]|uniref:Branched-chain alpha-ketoacid dehydrogenase kinase/Pyruvate dehydrogenase kinase N-terminal n=1 Tax=Penicillium nucicola TaxID=1850975 RepID=UPI0025452511|nr:Branched-chain alpha-ketoacid dehydrogenase kinase/Pyruvate dehydrogenase kinase N-terminal [Penicillium nucicola]KAJ5775169.1 Branched-chain alpha-ketoacid dehydrogenase kinase/Pyruvate dehydrogenase kinase N-terminal [Penicillium nucicola]